MCSELQQKISENIVQEERMSDLRREHLAKIGELKEEHSK